MLRKHNDESVIDAMDEVWKFLKNFQTRDQLIFNFVMWKNNLAVKTIYESSRFKTIFLELSHIIKIIVF